MTAHTQFLFRELTRGMVQLYSQGNIKAALDLVDRHAGEFPERGPLISFWRMCLLSLLGEHEQALEVLRSALEQGLWWHESQFNDADLDSLRELPEFKRLVGLSQEKYLQARAQVKPDRRVLVPDNVSGPLPLLVVLHGHGGNVETDLSYWETARQRGWLVLSVQSTQPLSSYSYIWDDPSAGLADIRMHYEEIAGQYRIDPSRLLMAGFSQGAGMALLAALKGGIPARGFIGVATWWEKIDELAAAAAVASGLRAYFITGEKDHTLERTREIEAALRSQGISVAEEFHAGIGHEFSNDFAASFEKAAAFLLEEAE